MINADSKVANGLRPEMGLLLALALACMAFTAADQARVSLELSQGWQEVAREPRISMGQRYVPIKPLLAPLDATLKAFEVGLRLSPDSVWVQGGNRNVEAPRSWFRFRQPWGLVEGELVIALEEVEDFFHRTFGSSLTVLETGGSGVARAAESNELAAIAVRDVEPEWQPVPMPEDDIGGDDDRRPVQPFDDLEPELQPIPDAPAEAEREEPFLVVVDPGHGGGDAGVVGGDGLAEKEVTLAVALELRAMFDNDDAIAIRLTRDDDRELTTSQRGAMVQQYGGDLFLSIHVGAGLAPDMAGHAVYFPRDETSPTLGERGSAAQRTLARRRVSQSEQWAMLMSKALERETGDLVRRTAPLRCRLLHHLNVPSLMAEIGVLQNGGDETQLSSGSYLRQVAQALGESFRAFHEAMTEER